MSDTLDSKDPTNFEPYFVVWCDVQGSNYPGDGGELQGALLSTSIWTMPTGTLVGSNEGIGAVTIAGIPYPANTVATIWLSSGTAGQSYLLDNTVTINDGRILQKSFIIPVEQH